MEGRLLLCATGSGCGKTTVTCSLLQSLVDRGISPVAFKSGPDYIDPMFHSEIIGAKSRNLDLFLMGKSGVLRSLWENGKGHLSIIEGAMGYYDGIAMSTDSSAYDLARQTMTPAVLIVDARGSALSAAALVAGFRDFRRDSGIQGVILNRISSMLYPRLKKAIEEQTGVPVFGFLPPCPEAALESRHLGLVTAAEVTDLKNKLHTLASLAEQHLNIGGLLALASNAPPIPRVEMPEVIPVPDHPRIAVAKDRAFCFYYEDALNLLQKLGAEIVPFSPMADRSLPERISGLYIGGGYPELYGQALSQNETMRRAIRKAIGGGIPTIAECGGFLYLHSQMEDNQGIIRDMAGVLPYQAVRTPKLNQFGYVNLKVKEDGLLAGAGEVIPAHEFHYWKSEQPGEAFLAEKPQSTRHWNCGFHSPTLYAGFPHVHFCGLPQAAKRFVEQCGAYQRSIL